MSTAQTGAAAPRNPLRSWPALVIVGLIVLLRLGVPLVRPDLTIIGILGTVGGFAAILVWWLFFSRAAWSERLLALAMMIVAAIVTWPFLHASIATGLMGRMFFVYALPFTLSLALVGWAMVTRNQSNAVRRATMVATLVLAAVVWTLVRTDGITGEGQAQLAWRWTPSYEERLLAQTPEPSVAVSSTAAVPATPAPERTSGNVPAASAPASSTAPPAAPAAARPADPKAAAPGRVAADVDTRPTAAWPGFRGPNRDGVVRGVRIGTDWSSSPPVEAWRRPIGPGWSSFAVDGELVYTQEQRGDHEVVSCYRLKTGEPVWAHRDAVRFYESNGGAGPRGTPTVHNGRVYALGATGVMNALDARTGAVAWSRNAQADTGAPLPGWGFAGSPLVLGDLVIVAASGRLVAYGLETGNPRWVRTTSGGGYSSPHSATLAGVDQILLQSGGGITSLAPADGTVLWQQKGEEGVSIVQPAVLPDGDVLFSGGDMMGGTGIRRLAVTRAADAWTATERWSTRGLKPYFNDFVVHDGHAFGFDGSILSCIDLATGERRWKGGRYGHGQLVLLREQGTLLVLSEEGELALVGAGRDTFTELARFKAIEGKTWNHPVLVGDLVLVRNGEQMAAFRLPPASR